MFARHIFQANDGCYFDYLESSFGTNPGEPAILQKQISIGNIQQERNGIAVPSTLTNHQCIPHTQMTIPSWESGL